MAFVLCLLSVAKVNAEESNTALLIIPRYDSSILNDGFDRWEHNNSESYVIHTSILFENFTRQNINANRRASVDSSRTDRSSLHLPIRYNITLKGYSVYDANDKSIKLWSFDKIDLNMHKKPELFFGVQKPFF